MNKFLLIAISFVIVFITGCAGNQDEIDTMGKQIQTMKMQNALLQQQIKDMRYNADQEGSKHSKNIAPLNPNISPLNPNINPNIVPGAGCSSQKNTTNIYVTPQKYIANDNMKIYTTDAQPVRIIHVTPSFFDLFRGWWSGPGPESPCPDGPHGF